MSEFDTEPEFEPDEVRPGDLVNFGPYGNLYVCNKHNDERWWVTDREADRGNPDASGWFMRAAYGQKIMEPDE